MKRKKSGNISMAGIAFGTVLLTIILILISGPALAKNIQVGIIDCYSGPPAVYGEDALNGFKLALQEINKKGVLGKKIEFTTRDTKFKVDIALNMAKELVLRRDVDVLVGTINSGAALAVSEAVAKKEKVPFIAWISKSENITGKMGHRYVFSTGENTAMAGKAGGEDGRTLAGYSAGGWRVRTAGPVLRRGTVQRLLSGQGTAGDRRGKFTFGMRGFRPQFTGI